jgi:hypothetical protein
MDLMDAMKMWEDMGNEIISWYKKDGHLYLFVENGDVKGYAKAVAGRMYWEWPEELMKQKES